MDNTRDEFGDVTDDSLAYLSSNFSGSFSNTATSDGQLDGVVSIIWQPTESVYYVQFAMVQYGDNPFSYTDADVTIDNALKTKSSSGQKESYLVVGVAPNAPLTVVDDGKRFVTNLCNENGQMECVLSFGSTTFRFTLDGNGFAELFDGYDKAIMDALAEREASSKAAAEAAADAVLSHDAAEAFDNIYSGETQEVRDNAAFYLADHLDEYAQLSQEELEALFPGTYYMTSAHAREHYNAGVGGSSAVYSFADGEKKQLTLFKSGGSMKDTSGETGLTKPYAVEGGLLKLDAGKSYEEDYSVRMVADGYYVLCDEDGDLQKVMYLSELNGVPSNPFE